MSFLFSNFQQVYSYWFRPLFFSLRCGLLPSVLSYCNYCILNISLGRLWTHVVMYVRIYYTFPFTFFTWLLPFCPLCFLDVFFCQFKYNLLLIGEYSLSLIRLLRLVRFLLFWWRLTSSACRAFETTFSRVKSGMCHIHRTTQTLHHQTSISFAPCKTLWMVKRLLLKISNST